MTFEEEFHKHEHFLMWMAHKGVRWYGLPFDEALMICQEAFWQAYQRYDPNSDASLTTFARYYCMGQLSYAHRTQYKRYEPDVDSMLDLEADVKLGEELEAESVRNHVLRVMREYLPQKEYDILYANYFLGKSYSTLAAEYGLSAQRICQIVKSARDKLYMVLNEEDFR